MRVNREEILKILESVGPGLAPREIIEQSSCLVFDNGRVMTFNEEVFCSRESPLDGIEGAVKAKPLLDLLGKMPDDEIEITANGAELLVNGKRRKAAVRMEQKVLLPVSEIEEPEEWRQLPEDFNDAVSLVHSCASREESQFVLTCIHIHPEYLESCDRFQIARYPMDTGVNEPILVRAESLKKILGFDMTEVSETKAWIHFRNPADLTLSCRRYLEEYKSLDAFITPEGTTPVSLPGGLKEVVSRAEIFSGENAAGNNNVLVELQADRIIIQGEGSSGWFKEMKQAKYDGDSIRFLIAPKLLVEISEKSEDCRVMEGRLFIDTGKFRYATATNKEKKSVEAAQ